MEFCSNGIDDNHMHVYSLNS